MISEYQATGMTCHHCVLRVTEEVSAVVGVSRVEVKLPTGFVTVTSQTALPLDQIRDALAEAGYDLVTV